MRHAEGSNTSNQKTKGAGEYKSPPRKDVGPGRRCPSCCCGQDGQGSQEEHHFLPREALAIASVEVEKYSALSLLGDLFIEKFHDLLSPAEKPLNFGFGQVVSQPLL